MKRKLETVEKNWKDLKKIVKVKEKENHDLEKENVLVSESLLSFKKELKDITLKVNKEMKDHEKKEKKDKKKSNNLRQFQTIILPAMLLILLQNP